MRVPNYIEESEDLKMSRAIDARQYREFLEWEERSEKRLWINRLCFPWEHHALPFSHRWDARRAA